MNSAIRLQPARQLAVCSQPTVARLALILSGFLLLDSGASRYCLEAAQPPLQIPRFTPPRRPVCTPPPVRAYAPPSVPHYVRPPVQTPAPSTSALQVPHPTARPARGSMNL